MNDLLLETLAWINYHRRKLIPNKKELSLQKYAVSERIVVVYYSEVLSEYAKKIWGVEKKMKFGIEDHW